MIFVKKAPNSDNSASKDTEFDESPCRFAVMGQIDGPRQTSNHISEFDRRETVRLPFK